MRPTLRSIGSLKAHTPMVLPGQRVGLMGGSFNPPHDGHVRVAETALRRLDLDQVWWLVTPGNPLKANGGLPPQAERMAAVASLLRDPRMKPTGFEAALGSSYTVDTLSFLRRRHPGVRFVWLMGGDGLAQFHRWRNWRQIAALMPIAVVDRPGFRLKAMAAPAAHALDRSFRPESRARSLPGANRGGRWTFLTTRLSPLSSTEIRAKSWA